jgi:hypothetical protein
MQLGEWRKTAPNRECMSTAVMNVLKPVLSDLGAADDPECWVEWGEDPQFRYLVLVPTRAGLISTTVRINTGTEGPRATGKLVRWTRLQLTELSLESAGGHRIVAVQVEGQVLKGADAAADLICEFVRGLIASVDGRDLQVSWDGAPVQGQPAARQKPVALRGAASKTPAKAPAKRAGTGTARLGTKPGGKATAAPKGGEAAPATKAPGTPRAAAKAFPRASGTAARPAAPAAAGPAAKRAARKPNLTTALILAPGPGATRPVRDLPPVEPARIAPHPIFAPVATPPGRSSDTDASDRGGTDDENRDDREARRPKTWTP